MVETKDILDILKHGTEEMFEPGEQSRYMRMRPETKRHYAAIDTPEGDEKPIMGFLRTWLDMQERVGSRMKSTKNTEAWEEIGRQLFALVDGGCGRLMPKVIKAIVVLTLDENGFETAELKEQLRGQAAPARRGPGRPKKSESQPTTA